MKRAKKPLALLLALFTLASLAGGRLPSAAAEVPETTVFETEADRIPETETSGETLEESSEAAMPAGQFTETLEESGITVTVDAPEGALPEGAVLHAELLGQDTGAGETAEELDSAGVSYDGFLALDIYFTAGDEEIEPAVPVTVQIQLPQEALPQDADAATLEVQHLVEDQSGQVEAVETVAGAGQGSVETADGADAVAQFQVEGFSVFTITWDKIVVRDGNISFVIRDTDGNELTLSDSYDLSYALPDSGVVDFEDMVRENGIETITVDGVEYVFRNATLVLNGNERHPIVSAERVWEGANYQIRFQDSIFPDSTGYYTRSELGSDEALELIYRRAEESDTEVYEPDPSYSKKAETADGGKTYDLTLSVSGEVGAAAQKQKVDVLFIVDQSASMDENNYQEMVARQASQLAGTLAGNENLDVRFAVVTFSSDIASTAYYKDALQRLSWTSDPGSVYAAANPYSTGGTNYQAGLMTGRSVMIESRPDAMKYVIFLSDGQPTYHYTSNGNSTGGGNWTMDADIESAEAEAANYSNVNGFFTIRVGNADTADEYLGRVSEAVRKAVGAEAGSEYFRNFAAEDSNELQKWFDEIQAQITSITMQDVSITDTLSEWATPVDGAEPYLVVRDEAGKAVELPEGTYEIWYTAGDLTLGVEFSEDYKLQDGYTYELHLLIQPSDLAYSTYGASGYPDGMTGEDGTGTYAGRAGFYSNEAGSARLHYRTDIGSHDLDYPMPVIQVPSVSLTISKTFTGLEEEQWAEAAAGLTFTVSSSDESYHKEGITLGYDAENGYSVTLDGLTAGREYTVTENKNTAPEGFVFGDTQVSVQGGAWTSGAEAKISLNKESSQNTVAYTNAYVREDQKLTISKTVTGNMGDAEKKFDFTLTLCREAGDYHTGHLDVLEGTTVSGYESGLDVTDGGHTYSFTLSDGEQIVIQVPYGYTAVVNEASGGYTAAVKVDGGDEQRGSQAEVQTTQDHTVAYTNKLEAVPPMGLGSGHTPYVLMVVLAAAACAVLTGGFFMRRRRRE